MLDREIGLTGPEPENAAQIPAAGVARVQRQRTVDQPDHSADILAEIRQHEGGAGEHARVILNGLERLTSEFDCLAAGCLRRFDPAPNDEVHVADRRHRQCGSVVRIDRDRLVEQSQSLDNPLLRHWKEDRKRAQVEIVGAEIGRRPRGGAAYFSCLQCRLDNTGSAESDFVLKLENIFQRAVETVGPQMRPAEGIDQLPGDPHLRSRLAHRAFQNVADAKFAPDLLHIYRLTLVGEGRIAGDDEEPADARERGDNLLDHTVGEIFLLWVATHVLEWQHRYRRLVWQREGWFP